MAQIAEANSILHLKNKQPDQAILLTWILDLQFRERGCFPTVFMRETNAVRSLL